MRKVRERFELNPEVERILHPSVYELAGLTEAIRTLRIEHQNDIENDGLAFQLAAALISHSRLSYIEEGLHIMETLIFTQWQYHWGKALSKQYQLVTPPLAGLRLGNDKGELVDTVGEQHNEAREALTSRTLSQNTSTTYRPNYSVNRNRRNDTQADPPHDLASARRTEPSLSATEDCSPEKGLSTTIKRSPRCSKQMKDLLIFHYYLALGCVKLKDFKRANGYVTQMLIFEPKNQQGLSLKRYIEVTQRQSVVMNAATIAGVSTVVTGVAVMLRTFLRGQ